MPELQLCLALYPRGCLREAVDAYITERAEYIAQATILDYEDRARWLYQAFGELRRLEDINHDVLRAVEREWGPKGKGLMLVTVRKRFVFLLSALKLAAARGIIRMDQVPPLPKIKIDSRRRERFLTLTEYQQLRMALSGRMRVLIDLAFWTGMHRFDLWNLKRSDLRPDYQWPDADGIGVGWTGAFVRYNSKNKKCKPCLIPAEPELVPIMREILSEPGSPDALLVGRVCNYARSIYAACDRIEMQPCSLMSCRHSIATLLMERTQDAEYARLFLGHETAVEVDPQGRYTGSRRGSILHSHYLHASPASLVAAMNRRTTSP